MTNKQIALIAAALVAAGRNEFESKEGEAETILRADLFLKWLGKERGKQAKSK